MHPACAPTTTTATKKIATAARAEQADPTLWLVLALALRPRVSTGGACADMFLVLDAVENPGSSSVKLLREQTRL